MARLIVSAALVVATLTQAAAVYADTIDDASVEANVDPGQLRAALDIQGLIDPYSYLRAVGELEPLPMQQRSGGYRQTVRLTYYTEYGRTASGRMTAPGTTACSSNFAFGTRFVLPDGETVVCDDRGKLGSSGWLDIWRLPAVAKAYGPYATVEVIP